MDAVTLRAGAPPAAGPPGAPLAFEHLLVDGMRLRVGHRAAPARGAARGTAVILTGRAEFVEKYEETVADLAAMGFAVAIFDWRGQGGSERFAGFDRRGHVLRIEDYLADLEAVLAHLERRGLPRPWLMLGHSMGGHVGLRHLAQAPGRFAGAMLTAPMFGIDLRPLPRPVARAVCRLAVGIGAGPRYAPGQRDFNPARLAYARNKLTSCPDRFADFRRLAEATPELVIGGVNYHWLAASLRSIALIHRPGFPESIRVPVVVCQAGRERMVCNRSIARIARRLPHGRLLVFPDARHELLRERASVRRRVLDAFVGLADQVTVAPG
jgi:lysophospholipase